MTEQTYLLMHRHINGYGRLFGGQLMQWIDELAGIVSMRHAGGRITTASIDNLNFKAGAYLNDTIVLIIMEEEPGVQSRYCSISSGEAKLRRAMPS